MQKYAIVIDTKMNVFSLKDIVNDKIIESVGDVKGKDVFGQQIKFKISDLLYDLRLLEAKEYIKECIENKTMFSYNYNSHHFKVGGITTDGKYWYTNCSDYVDDHIAVSTSYYEFSKLPCEIGVLETTKKEATKINNL